MRHSRTTTLALTAVLATVMVAGCSSDDTPSDGASATQTTQAPSSDTTTTEAPGTSPDDAAAGSLPDGVTVGLPEGVEPPAEASGGAGLGADGATLWVVTFGSSTNPTVATVESADSSTVTVALNPVDPDGPATADYVPTTTVLDLPDGLDTAAPIQVVLAGTGTVEVDGVDTPGWVTASAG